MDHRNNLTPIRIVAASLVVLAHSHDLLGEKDAMVSLVGFSFGNIGVRAFFIVSGYLIFRSLERSPNLLRFAWARAVRILPGLWAMLAVSVLFLGLFVTTRSPLDFFESGQTVHYLLSNATAYYIVYALPGVFDGNVTSAVNGPLWTLPLEIECYLITAIAFTAGLFRGPLRWFSFAAVLFASLVYRFDPAIHVPGLFQLGGEPFVSFGGAFVMGLALAAAGSRLRIGWMHIAAALFAVAATVDTPLIDLTVSAFVALLVYKLAFLDGGAWPVLRRLPDISYGIYIYAFVIQQTLIAFAPPMVPMELAAVTLCLVLIPATLSWFLVEKPALRLKSLPKLFAPPISVDQNVA